MVLFDPLPLLSDMVSGVRIRWELPRALGRWESRAPSSYRIHVKGAFPMVCFVDGELTVRDGRLVGARMRANSLVPDSPLQDVGPSDWQRPGCSYEGLTVERMFERVAANLEEAGVFGVPVIVQFDEEWGFIAEYRFGRSSVGGILGPTVSECCTWFEFDNLSALAP